MHSYLSKQYINTCISTAGTPTVTETILTCYNITNWSKMLVNLPFRLTSYIRLHINGACVNKRMDNALIRGFPQCSEKTQNSATVITMNKQLGRISCENLRKCSKTN